MVDDEWLNGVLCPRCGQRRLRMDPELGICFSCAYQQRFQDGIEMEERATLRAENAAVAESNRRLKHRLWFFPRLKRKGPA